MSEADIFAPIFSAPQPMGRFWRVLYRLAGKNPDEVNRKAQEDHQAYIRWLSEERAAYRARAAQNAGDTHDD